MAAAEHYDAVVIGRGLSGLLTAALLARRQRRVRVMLPDAPPDPVPPPPLFGLGAPIVQRVLDVLGLVHSTRQRLSTAAEPVVLALPDRRLVLETDIAARGRALGAAFPDVQDELLRLFARIDGYGRSLDTLLGGDIELPPEGFAARRALRKQVMSLPVSLLVGVAPPWSEVPALRAFVGASLAVAGRHEDPSGPISAGGARAIWHLCHGVHRFKDGPGALADMVADKLRTFGGAFDPERPVRSVTVRRKRAVAVYDNRKRRYSTDVVIFADNDAVMANLIGTPPPVAGGARVRHAVVPIGERPVPLVDPCGWMATPGGPAARVRVEGDVMRMAWHGDRPPASLDRLTPFATIESDLTETCSLPAPTDDVDLLHVFRRPIRTELKNVLRTGPWALPGLGLEGESFTAWQAAELAGRLLPRLSRLGRR